MLTCIIMILTGIVSFYIIGGNVFCIIGSTLIFFGIFGALLILSSGCSYTRPMHFSTNDKDLKDFNRYSYIASRERLRGQDSTWNQNLADKAMARMISNRR